MDGSYHRPRKTPSSDRILALFSNPATNDGTALASSAADGELDEGEVFWTGTEFDSSAQDNSTAPSSASPQPSPSPSPSPSSSPAPIRGFQSPSFSSAGSFRRASFGILAVLPEDTNDAARPQITPRAVTRSPSFLSQRIPVVTTTTGVVGGGGGGSISSSPSTASASPSSATSATAAARAIPAIPRPRLQDYSSFSMPVRQQSAPVNVPLPQGRHKFRRAFGEEEPAAATATNGAATNGEDEDEEEMMPPHEIVARASAKDSPLTTFSVLEGAGRTLKGRDLRRVRNAVWRQTGFLD